MAFILPIEEPWTSQPQGAVGIDWSNPLTKWLCAAINIHGEHVFKSLPVFGSGISTAVDGNGEKYLFSGTQSSASCTVNNAFTRGALSGAVGLTVSARFVVTDLSAERCIVAVYSNSPETGQFIFTVSSSGRVVFGPAQNASNVFFRQTNAGDITTGKAYHVVCTWSALENSCYCWINGVRQASAMADAYTLGIVSYINTAATKPLTLGTYANGGSPFIGGVSDIDIWATRLSDSAVSQIFGNPWQIFAP